MSGKQYKNGLSDTPGILHEHQRRNEPIARSAIKASIKKLYGDAALPETTSELLNVAFAGENRERQYNENTESQKLSKGILMSRTAQTL
ncbi:MAG: hypothetical protein LBU32_08115 [Clostridiales bacterium]|nr:hypothetical protein [Clostridiales bacterium]